MLLLEVWRVRRDETFVKVFNVSFANLTFTSFAGRLTT